jgi:hypothetical protein
MVTWLTAMMEFATSIGSLVAHSYVIVAESVGVVMACKVNIYEQTVNRKVHTHCKIQLSADFT